MFTFIPSKVEILVKKDANFLAWEEDRWRLWAPILIFCVDVHMELTPPPVHMHPPEPDTLSPSVWTS